MKRLFAFLAIIFAQIARGEQFITANDEVDLFVGHPCELTWNVHALPGSEVAIRGQVFQASLGLAVPLKDLSFEINASIKAGTISAEARHTLNLPEGGRVATYVVKWQSKEAKGNVIVQVFPTRVLSGYPSVTIDNQTALLAVRKAFDAEKITTSANWTGIRFTKAEAVSEVEQFKIQSLQSNQAHVVFADLPGLRGTTFSKPAGEGRLVIMPTSFLSRFPNSPIIQKTILDLITR